MLILIVEDDQGIAFLISEVLENPDRTIELVYTGEKAVSFIIEKSPDLVILDYSLPDMNAKSIIDILSEKEINIPPFIVSTGQGDEFIAVEMMKKGAHDYLVKDTSLMQRLPGVVNRAIDDILKERKLQEALESKKISDEKLLEERKRLDNIIRATNVGTWEWDIQNDIFLLNERWANIMGYSLSDLMPFSSENLKNLIHPDDYGIAEPLLKKHFKGDIDYYEIELRCKHKNGNWVWVLNRGGVMEYGPDQRPLLMAGTTQDISDKKQRQELEKEVLVANKNLQFKQSFLASMSHEMRTPLTGILGITEILAKSTLDEQQRDFVHTLKNASENLKDIIDQVLDYSKIEAGKMTIKRRPFVLKSLMDKADDLFNNICKKPITFTANLDEQLPEIVEADCNKIFQVISTLMVNGVKYSEQGKLSLSLKKEKITDPEVMMVRVEVTDTGIGIREEKQKIIFEPFAEINQIDTSLYEGTGLGLAICKEFVEMHGGEIGLKSHPGEGTTFYFTFKALIPDPGANKNGLGHDKMIHPRVKLNILFTEDKIITQKIVKLQLKDMGHEVTLAANGREAIEKVQQQHFDLILMDIQMPVMDGITATQYLKSEFNNLPPVVGLSANAFEGDREKYMNLGFDEYITKPMQKQQFIRVINKLFVDKAI